jgi:hypothetical protein
MRFFRALVALALFASAGYGAEVALLKGEVLKGEVVRITDKEVVLKEGDKETRKAIAEVLRIDLRDVPKRPAGKVCSQVELTDGSLVYASKWWIKKKTFEMTLLAGPTVKLPLSAVANVLNSAQSEDHRREWKTRTFNTRGKEAVVQREVIKDKETGKESEVISNIVCTLGKTDEKGEKITIGVVIEDESKEYTKTLMKLHGIIFKHVLGVRAAPVICKLLDMQQDLVMVSRVTPREGGLIVTTPSGVKLDLPYDQLGQLDYAKGKLDYLSALEAGVEIKPSIFDDGEAKERWFVYKDSSLENKPIRLGGATFPKGLTLLPGVELTYDLKGNYQEFSATVGIDDGTNGEGEAVLTIEADGKVLKSMPIVYRTEKGKTGEARKPPRPAEAIALNIRNVNTLKISLKAKDELNGLSINVSLGNAKVSK